MLIDRTEIAKHREISKSVREDKINPYIEDAERLDLKPLLGEKLFNAIEKTPVDHGLLLDGGEYTYQGEPYNHPGLKKVLCLFAYARYVMFGSYTDTAFGFVEKSSQDSKPVADAHKRAIYTENQKAASGYWAEVATYLNRMNYELWNISCTTTRRRLKISKIN